MWREIFVWIRNGSRAIGGNFLRWQDLQAAGAVTYSLLREEDAFVICVQRDEEPPVERMLCDTGEERAGMLTRFLYENAVEPDQMPAILRDICGWAVG